jgi:diguanylate cyclase (GGDEF)-like protein
VLHYYVRIRRTAKRMGASLVLKKTRVLIVDDEQETLDLIEEYLIGRDFDVTTTMSGEQAVAIVQKDLFHIAIVDLHLPGMTGAELLKSIKSIRSDVQVVMITGYGTIRDAVECMKLGASDFITKPILLDHLHLTIRRILEEVRLKEEAELADYYRNLSRTDELTGLYNFRHLMSVLKNEVSRHLRYNRTLSLAMIDIDDFKKYNDAKGHEEGNELLVRLAHVFKHNTRNCDILARYGGEEFIIIFPETSIEEALVVSQRICNTVESTLGVSVTIGLSSLPKDTSEPHEIIRIADAAMYWGKIHGKNQIAVYESSMSTCR